MARMIDDCRWCRHELRTLIWPDRGVMLYCAQCDTAPCTAPGSKLRAGPPKASGTNHGWFAAPEEWNS